MRKLTCRPVAVLLIAAFLSVSLIGMLPEDSAAYLVHFCCLEYSEKTVLGITFEYCSRYRITTHFSPFQHRFRCPEPIYP